MTQKTDDNSNGAAQRTIGLGGVKILWGSGAAAITSVLALGSGWLTASNATGPCRELFCGLAEFLGGFLLGYFLGILVSTMAASMYTTKIDDGLGRALPALIGSAFGSIVLIVMIFSVL